MSCQSWGGMLSAAIWFQLSSSLICVQSTPCSLSSFETGFRHMLVLHKAVSNGLLGCGSMLEHDHGDYTTGWLQAAHLSHVNCIRVDCLPGHLVGPNVEFSSSPAVSRKDNQGMLKLEGCKDSSQVWSRVKGVYNIVLVVSAVLLGALWACSLLFQMVNVVLQQGWSLSWYCLQSTGSVVAQLVLLWYNY